MVPGGKSRARTRGDRGAAAEEGGEARAVQLYELQRGLRLLQRTLHREGCAHAY